jgi:hypothetical protein
LVSQDVSSPKGKVNAAVFWSLFVGAYALMANISLTQDPHFAAIQRRLYSQIRQCSIACRVTNWEEARYLLSIVAWPLPDSTPLDGVARDLWYQAISPRSM